ncbi:MAG: tRNA epoxyqueuosine(34) reductase QueG [Planctomycetota bacterium]|nr:tRNA epoxyqueuosine(34) reductase QueG [Planctomycetota bacterium]
MRPPSPSLSPESRRSLVLEQAHEIGFDLVGIAPFGPPPDAARFNAWIEENRHGTMSYLARGRAATVDPRSQWPAGKSLLVVGLGHSRPALHLPGGGRVARYAAGRDYHNVISKMLGRLRRALLREGLASPGSAFVDATPLLERSHAAEGGLGSPSKAANLLDVRFGPWFFLGELILDLDLSPTPAPSRVPSCGTCTACIDACPTDAILEPGRVDATRCISYHTIEHRGLVPHDLRSQAGEWAFGCDVCSEVCPWGSKAPDLTERFGTRTAFEEGASQAGTLVDLLATGCDEPDDAGHKERWRGSPLRRPGREGLARNAAVVLGNRPSEPGLQALLLALESDPSPTVRAASAWALAAGHLEDSGVRESISKALGREGDHEAASDMRASLDREG